MFPGFGDEGPQAVGDGGKKVGPVIGEEDLFLTEKSSLPTGILAVHVFGCENLFVDNNYPPDHYKLYAQLSVGPLVKYTSVKSPFKKGRVVWNDVRNFPLPISGKVGSTANKVVISVMGYDSLQTLPKHKHLGKTEFHLYKLIKKQWSMDRFELLNRKKQYSGDVQLEFAFAYGTFGYGVSDQLINGPHPAEEAIKQSMLPHLEPQGADVEQSLGVVYVPQKLFHPSFIPFGEKVMNLEPDISSTYGKRGTRRGSFKPRTQLLQEMKRLKPLRSEYSMLGSRTKRIHFLQQLLTDKDLQIGDYSFQESDSDESGGEEGTTHVGLGGLLAQMANLTFVAGAPGLVQSSGRRRAPTIVPSGSTISKVSDEDSGEPSNPNEGNEPSWDLVQPRRTQLRPHEDILDEGSDRDTDKPQDHLNPGADNQQGTSDGTKETGFYKETNV